MTSKAIVEQWLNTNRIAPKGFLLKDLEDGNNNVLDLIAFAVTEYSNLLGLRRIVREFGQLEQETNETERVCENLLTELLAIRFVTNVLKERVVGLEALSPHRIDAKRCDIETIRAANVTAFYDVKDLSSEILGQKPDDKFPGLATFDPVRPDKIRPWLKDRVDSCIAKGANYLIASLPVWHVKSRAGAGKLREDWVKPIYPDYLVLSPNRFRVVQNNAVPAFFKGVYVIRFDEHLLLEF
jgi:hypothetical protein